MEAKAKLSIFLDWFSLTPKRYTKYEDTGANQQAQVGTSARLCSEDTKQFGCHSFPETTVNTVVVSVGVSTRTFADTGKKKRQLDKTTRCRALQGPSLVMRE